MTVSVILAGLVFAAFGGRQLTVAARNMTDAVGSVLGAVFVWIAVPFLAVLAIMTLVGLPFGIGLLVFLLPALWFLGYIVAGARLGGWLVGLAGGETGGRPYLAVALGLLILQLIVLLPVVGGIVVALAGAWGAGALAITIFRGAGGGIGAGANRIAPAPPASTTPQTA
jgi:hypothetical protein